MALREQIYNILKRTLPDLGSCIMLAEALTPGIDSIRLAERQALETELRALAEKWEANDRHTDNPYVGMAQRHCARELLALLDRPKHEVKK